jgi:AraC-like DNA-binding protein
MVDIMSAVAPVSAPPTAYDRFTPPAAARRLCWHVLGGGRSRYVRPTGFEAFSNPGAVLMWVEAGAGTLRVGPATFQLERGPKFWLFAKDRPRWFTPAPRSRFVLRSLRFSGPDLHAYLDALRVPEQAEFTFDGRRAAQIRALNERLWRVIRGRRDGWCWEMHLIMTGLLRHFLDARDVLAEDTGDLPEPVKKAVEAVDSQPFRDWHADELARTAGLSYAAFRRLFREHRHESVHEHLQRRRADAARHLLSDPRLQIKAIAQQLHFASDRYFSYFFRQQTGMSPTEYRNLIGVDENA